MSNKNGKISQQVYINQILNPHVRKWIERGDKFELEEDRDSGHGPEKKKNNKIRRWKAQYELRSWFNAPTSPDLSVIETCFRRLKQFLSNSGHRYGRALRRVSATIYPRNL